MTPRYRQEYPSEPRSEAEVLDWLEHVLAENKVDPHLSRDIMLAVSEAFNNAMIHGNKWDPDKEVSVCMDVDHNCVVVSVTDQGSTQIGDLPRYECRDPEAEGGRGLGLIRRLASRAGFSQTPDGAIKVTVEFDRFHNKSIRSAVITGGDHGDHR